MPELARGLNVPLFDRLRAEEGSASAYQQHLLVSRAAVQESIGRELQRLFNTRRASGGALVAGPDATVLDYGIPDFSPLSVHSGPDRDALAAGIADAIRWFEPRLAQPKVQVLPPREPGGPVIVLVTGDALIDTRVERVAFDMSL